MTFDPYHKWLGILPKDQPPNHYRLLSLEAFESDPDVIEGAADRGMGFIRQYQSGEHAVLAANLLNEIATARLCLLKPKSKADYDAKLRAALKSKNVDRGDGVSFSFDPELTAILSAPRSTSEAKPKKKPNAKAAPQGLIIAGGVGGVVVVILAVLILNSARVSPPKIPTTSEAAEVASKRSPSVKRQSTTLTSESPSTDEQMALAASNPTQEPPMTEESTEIPEMVAPTEPKAIGESVNLLALVDPKRDTLDGTWIKEGDVLRVMGDTVVSRLAIPADLPAEYRLTIRLAREPGGGANNECLVLRLPVGTFMADVLSESPPIRSNSRFRRLMLPLNDFRGFTLCL